MFPLSFVVGTLLFSLVWRPTLDRIDIIEAWFDQKLVSAQEKLEFVCRRRFPKSEAIDLLMGRGEEKVKRIDELNKEL